MIEQIGFGLIAGCIVLSALLVARARNAIHGVLWLGVVLGATAVLYVMLRAPFLAGIQILLYVGGVMTLMILGVMLTRHDQEEPPLAHKRPWLAGLLSCGMLGMLVKAILSTPELPSSTSAPVTTKELGRALLTDHALAFETLSLLLLATMIGAIVLLRKDRPTTPSLEETR